MKAFPMVWQSSVLDGLLTWGTGVSLPLLSVLTGIFPSGVDAMGVAAPMIGIRPVALQAKSSTLVSSNGRINLLPGFPTVLKLIFIFYFNPFLKYGKE
jgi:hypothetical protein